MFIDKRYFVGDLAIEGLIGDASPSQTEKLIEKQLNVFIDKYEPEYLLSFLGEKMFVDFAAYCQVHHEEKIDSWKSVLNRMIADWMYAGNRVLSTEEALQLIYETDKVEKGHFEELITLLFDGNTSPVANYVYFQMVRARQIQITSLGATVANSDNELVLPNSKLCFAWNGMVDMNSAIDKFICSHAGWYTKYCPNKYLFRGINRLNI